jgi:death-on-curing protein
VLLGDQQPLSGYYSDIIQEAAALWESLSQNHPFIDGNKRVAVTVASAFLRVNGCPLEFDDVEAFSFLVGLYETRALRITILETGLRQHAVPRNPPN